MSHRKHAHTLGTLLFAAALTACGSSSPSPEGAPPATHSPSGSSAAAASPSPEPQLLRKKELSSALLSLSEMPAGWSADTSDDSSTNKTFCDYKQPHQAKVTVSGNFQKGAGVAGSIAAVGLRQYASVDDAADAFAALEGALKTCHKETYEGAVLNYSAMSVEKLGDRSLGVRIESGGYTLLQQFTLDGPTLINVGTGGMATVDADTTALLLRKQVERYEAAAAR
ncbi:hypothetical protein ACFYXJ_14330 [Streptomyces sp. NPDC002667]|uniref:hypothetical protein n=1 Tax=Streptomyces sp. NPDC002667 TaxID=3364657 RepID=UPI0036A79A84